MPLLGKPTKEFVTAVNKSKRLTLLEAFSLVQCLQPVQPSQFCTAWADMLYDRANTKTGREEARAELAGAEYNTNELAQRCKNELEGEGPAQPEDGELNKMRDDITALNTFDTTSVQYAAYTEAYDKLRRNKMNVAAFMVAAFNCYITDADAMQMIAFIKKEIEPRRAFVDAIKLKFAQLEPPTFKSDPLENMLSAFIIKPAGDLDATVTTAASGKKADRVPEDSFVMYMFALAQKIQNLEDVNQEAYRTILETILRVYADEFKVVKQDGYLLKDGVSKLCSASVGGGPPPPPPPPPPFGIPIPPPFPVGLPGALLNKGKDSTPKGGPDRKNLLDSITKGVLLKKTNFSGQNVESSIPETKSTDTVTNPQTDEKGAALQAELDARMRKNASKPTVDVPEMVAKLAASKPTPQGNTVLTFKLKPTGIDTRATITNQTTNAGGSPTPRIPLTNVRPGNRVSAKGDSLSSAEQSNLPNPILKKPKVAPPPTDLVGFVMLALN